MISSELEENLNLCDRVLIVRNGEIVAEVAKKDISKQKADGSLSGYTRGGQV